MEETRRRARYGWGILLGAALTSCTPGPPIEALATPQDTLASAGKRLIESHSAADLTARSARTEQVLEVLTSAERDALARGYVRFRIDRDSDVCIAAPRGSVPFWVTDLDFKPAGLTFREGSIEWDVFRKRYDPGWVGLGVNGLDRTTPAHYAVFVRSRDGKPVTVSGLVGEGWRTSTAGDAWRPAIALPESLRGSILLHASDDLRHSTLLAGGRVWKTHVVSSRTPDQVTVAFGAEPFRELVWSWRTAPQISATIVALRKPGSRSVRLVAGTSETIALREVLNDPVVRRHTVHVDRLESATAYEYAVGDGSPEGMTEWTTVRTAPRGGDVCLLYMGDPQCGLEGWGKLLAAAYQSRPDANALLIAGDLVDRGNERTNWDHFFLRAAGVFERLPLMPCVGNHEYLDRGPWLYRSFFSLPANGPRGIAHDLVYSVEIGDALIAVLDSTLAVSDSNAARLQAEWLDERLTQTRRTWKIVMFHHPLYASHTSRESPALRDAWVPVLDRHHVDLVLQGHDHAYLRTYPMRAGRRTGSPAEGTVYVVSVSGDKYYEQDPRNYTEVGFTGVSTYQTIDLMARAGRLVYRCFDVEGRERDRFTIQKPAQTDPQVASDREVTHTH